MFTLTIYTRNAADRWETETYLYAKRMPAVRDFYETARIHSLRESYTHLEVTDQNGKQIRYRVVGHGQS